MSPKEVPVPMDGVRLLYSPVAAVELPVIMLDVILLNLQLTKFLTVEYVEW